MAPSKPPPGGQVQFPSIVPECTANDKLSHKIVSNDDFYDVHRIAACPPPCFCLKRKLALRHGFDRSTS
jgi:hypothetical protein